MRSASPGHNDAVENVSAVPQNHSSHRQQPHIALRMKILTGCPVLCRAAADAVDDADGLVLRRATADADDEALKLAAMSPSDSRTLLIFHDA